MKKLLVLLAASFSVFATSQQELSERLSLNDGFSADFAQQVITPDGDVVMQGEGRVDIARPNQFRWETTLPDENLLVSDGEDLWYYSPFIEQVTIYKQEQATAQTPFILLTRNNESDWQAYRVEQTNDLFTLHPTADDSTQGVFQIEIDSKGIVKGFKVIEQDGQRSEFAFSQVELTTPKASTFTFTVPEGIDVDDQR